MNESPQTSVKQYIAAKGIIRRADGKVLVLRQSFEEAVDGAGRYHLPGGIVELGETLRAALTREVLEETKLEIEVHKILAVEEWRANIRGDECYFVGIFFDCSLKGGTLDTNNEETSGFAWIGKEDLKDADVLQPSKRVIEEAIHTFG